MYAVNCTILSLEAVQNETETEGSPVTTAKATTTIVGSMQRGNEQSQF